MKEDILVKKDILDNIVAKTEKNIFKKISADTGRLLEILKEAERRYLAGSWLKSRQNDFAQLIEAVQSRPAAIDCLLNLFTFIINSKGGWASTSANTFIMRQLIDASDYKMDWDKTDFVTQQDIFIRLKTILCRHIEKHTATFKQEKLKEFEEKQQLALLREVIPRQLVNVILNDNPEAACESQINHPDKTIFCLCPDEHSKWQLTWYDIKKRPNFLPKSNQIKELLNKLPDNKIPLSGFELHEKLKTCCDAQLGEESMIYLFNDSHDAAEFAKNHPGKYSICLIKNADKWHATWYNLYGKPVVLMCDELIKCLSTSNIEVLPAPDTELYFKLKKNCVKAIDLLLANKIQLRINKEPAPSSYVLTHSPDTITLIWYDSIGNPKPIDLVKHPVLDTWLKSMEQLSETSVKQLKTWLMSVTIRRDIDEAKKRVALNVLQKKFGITLIAANHFGDILPFKLQEGVYIITKEPAIPDGIWTLYQRQKNRYNNLIDISGAEWGGLRAILARYSNVLPNELDVAVKKSISDSIFSIVKLREQDNQQALLIAEIKPKSFVNQDEKIVKTLQQIHGIALLFADSFEQVPKFKRIAGTFLLSKQSGEWQLYQRQRLGGTQLIDTSGEQWRSLHLLLAGSNADDLYVSGHSSLKQAVRLAVQSGCNTIEQKLVDCVALNHLSDDSIKQCSPCSFVLTREKDNWCLYYLDALHVITPVDLNAHAGVQALLNSWEGEPESLLDTEINYLRSQLKIMKPEALDKQKFVNVIKHIGGINDLTGLSSSSHEQENRIIDAPIEDDFQQNKANFAKLFKPAIVTVSAPPPPPPMPS